MVSKVIFSLLVGAISPALGLPSDASATSSALQVQPTISGFNPRHYTQYQKTARCKGVNRSNPSKPVTKDLNLQYTYIGNPNAKRTLVLVHGWPGLWSTWSNQILHFNESYNLLIPTLRGFGPSTHPGDVQTSGNIPDLIEDVACVMRAANVQVASCIGHDWGSQICYEGGRSRPDIFDSVAAIDIPYQPAQGNFTPIADLVPLVPHLAYQVYFSNDTNSAVKELNTDIRRTLRSVYRGVSSPPPDAFLESTTDFFDAWGTQEIPPITWFSQEEEDYLVEQYSIQKFEFSLEFYTTPNRITTFNIPHAQGNLTIPQPTLVVYPTEDPVANWTQLSEVLGSAAFIPHLTTETVGAAHWPQLEQPAIVNQILEKWLNTLPAPKH